MLVSQKFVGTLLALTSEIAIGELAAIGATMKVASNVNSIRGKAGDSANVVLICVFNVRKVDVSAFFGSLQIMGHIWAMVWSTGSTRHFH